MKGLFWIGLMVLLLGVASLFVSIPQREKHGINVGGAEVGVEVKEQRRIAPVVSAALIVGGAVMLIAGRKKTV